MDATSFTGADAENPVVQRPPSNAEIVAELLETEDVSNHNNDAIETEDEPMYCPGRNELFCKLSRQCKYSPCFHKIVQLFNLMQKSRQKAIRDYFQNL